MRDAVSKSGKACFSAVFKVKTRLMCASCDNNAGSKLSSNAAVQKTDMADFMNQCNQWRWNISGMKTLIGLVLTYANTINVTTPLTTELSDLAKVSGYANAACQTLPNPKTAGQVVDSLNFDTAAP